MFPVDDRTIETRRIVLSVLMENYGLLKTIYVHLLVQDNRHMRVVSLSTLCNGRLYPKEISLVLIYFCYRLSQPQGHSAAGRIMSMKNSNDTIGNQTRWLE